MDAIYNLTSHKLQVIFFFNLGTLYHSRVFKSKQ